MYPIRRTGRSRGDFEPARASYRLPAPLSASANRNIRGQCIYLFLRGRERPGPEKRQRMPKDGRTRTLGEAEEQSHTDTCI